MAALKLVSSVALLILSLRYAFCTSEFEFKRDGLILKDLNNKITRKERLIRSPSEESDELHSINRRQGLACCNASTPCQNSAYRTIDGTCNNVNNPCWGAAGVPFNRWLPPVYGDNLGTPRGQGSNPALPRPRSVAAAMVATNTTQDPDNITIFVMLWGQWLDHDITFTPDQNATGCCTSNNAECINIDVSNDTFYRTFSVNCLPLGRSIPTTCLPGSRREQTNANTAFIDGSQVYGSSQATLTNVRDGNTIFLKIKPSTNEVSSCPASSTFNCPLNFLPEQTNPATGNLQFFAGDIRVEEQPSLTSLHHMFLRAHNHIAARLKALNPSCPDETVFQETRKIIGALQQQITFNEFLPIVLGSGAMDEYGLTLWPKTDFDYNFNGYFTGYSTLANPTAFNYFATASYRFGHSLIRNTFNLPGGPVVNLAESFNNHAITLNAATFPSKFLKAMSIDPPEKMDQILADAVHNKLFATTPFQRGEDLYSRNIQRGRDHGLLGYLSWLNDCRDEIGLQPVQNFDQIQPPIMPDAVVRTFQAQYAQMSDIDLFPAGIAEFHMADALLGFTFQCLNARYFQRLKYGDRYWFERSNIFTPAQLNTIHGTTLAQLICRFSTVTQIQNFVMKPDTPSGSNQMIDCSQILQSGIIADVNNGTHSTWLNQCTG